MYRFGIIGDDVRMKYLFDGLKKDGYAARYTDGDGATEVIADSDIIVLPVNRLGLLALCKNKTVFGGFTSVYDVPTGATVYNYLDNGVYTVKNALATAEGAVFVAMQNQSTLLAGKSVAVCGFGNIGKILCHKLLALGCFVTVCARSELQRAEAENMGAAACGFAALPLFKPSIIFNTVPAPVLNSAVLSALCDDTLIIELASAPGGVDKNYADAHGICVIKAGGLPAKYCPRFAGEVLKNTVLSMLEEV